MQVRLFGQCLNLLQAEGLADFIHIVEFLPREQLHTHCLVAVILRIESLVDDFRLASYVPIGRRLLIDWLAKFQAAGCMSNKPLIFSDISASVRFTFAVP